MKYGRKTMNSKVRVLLIVALTLSAVVWSGTPDRARAAGETWTVVSAISIGCNSGDTGFNVAYSNIDPLVNYYQETWVEAGGLVYMDEWIGPTTPFDTSWYLYNANDRGLQTATFPIPQPATVILRLYDAAQQPIYETRLTLYCIEQTYTIDFSGPVTPGGEEEPVVLPGCDVLMPIPSTAVVGSFVADAPVYWKPGDLTNPLVTIKAGNTAWVLGQDASGQYYKIVWVCDLVWVPKASLGPNYDAIWNGKPLPTEVVQ